MKRLLIILCFASLAYGQVTLTTGVSLGPNVSIGKSTGNPKVLVAIAITPATASVTVGNSANFTATGTFSDSTTADVTLGFAGSTTLWVSSNTAVATISAAADPQPVLGVSNGTSNISASLLGVNSNIAVISVNPTPLTITTNSCPLAINGTAYTCQLKATGGTPAYTWSISVGALPAWATLNTSTGAITGTPNVNGTTTFTAKVTDSLSATATQVLSITVSGGNGTPTDENFYDNADGTCNSNMAAQDGPANLPTKCYNTALVNTPSPGGFFCVAPNGQALPATCTGSVANYTSIATAFSFVSSTCSPASATCIPCGSTIKIVATNNGLSTGTQNIYDETNLQYPAVTCNSTHWNTVETDMVASLPPEQTRISPAWTNLPTLPSRPSYNQPATVGTYMPMIRNVAFSQAIFKLSPAASTTGPFTAYLRIIGLEMSQPSPGTTQCAGKNCQTGWNNFIFSTNCDPTNGTICPDHIILDRVIVDADAHTGTTTNNVCFGVFGVATSFAVIDSYIYDIKSAVNTSCESHGISFGNVASTNASQGPYKIVNNYVEAAAENLFTGGGLSVSSPMNIQVRRNHMFKPFNLWMPLKPGYLGTPMLAKNVFETKDALQILIEGNIFDYAWYGLDKNGAHVSDQFGAITLLHTKASVGETHKVAAQDYTYRYNWARHSARATDVAAAGCDSDKQGCGPTFPPGRTPGIIQRESIHDNVWDDVSTKWFVQPYGGLGSFDTTNISTDNTNLSVGTNGTNNNIFINHNTFIATSYSQDLTVASITISGAGTATLTYNGSPPAGAGTGVGRKIQIFGSCTNFNEYAVIATTTAGAFTYASGAPINTSCNSGFVSLLQPVVGGAFNMNEASSDSPIVAVSESGTLAQVTVNPQPSANSIMQFMCIGAGVQTGCTASQTTTFTVYGLTGTLACYNSNQANCGSGGTTTTPANWTLVGRVNCLVDGLNTVTINTAGTGYLVNQVVNVLQTGASGGSITITSVGTGGVVTGISLNGRGSGYAAGNGLSTKTLNGQPGTGLTVNVTITGNGFGFLVGTGSTSSCVADNRIFFFNSIQSGLPASTTTGNAFFSYWASLGLNNYGTNPNAVAGDINPAWQNITVTNNILEGKVQTPNTSQCTPTGNNATSANALNTCGMVATLGTGAVNWTCNVVVSHPWIAQLGTTDTLPNGNVDTGDHTLTTVGFNNFNFDNLGAGIINLNDIALNSSSSYFTGVSTAGCTSDGLPTGANINNVITYTAGVN